MTGRALLLAVAAPVCALLVFTGGLTIVFGGGSAACTTPATTPTGTAASTTARMGGATSATRSVNGFDAEQVSNATVIVQTGQRLGVPVRGWIIAVATAIQESSLHNVGHGDAAGPDSIGLFQQRDDWGPRHARLDPARASRFFYLGGSEGQPGLLDITGWQTMPLTQAAQAVQRSAHPDAYATHEVQATNLVAAITGTDGLEGFAGATSCTEPANAAAAQAIAFARDQLGVPYRWGGDGTAEGGFDCSGLTHAAYAAAGLQIPRTAQAQYDAGALLPADVDLLPGDLVFFGTGTRHVTHVGIFIGDSQMIDAPHAGARVRIEKYQWGNYLGANRPARGNVRRSHLSSM